MNRRDFLKKSAVAGTVVAGASVVKHAVSPVGSYAAEIGVKRHDGIDSILNISSDYTRYEQKHTAFNLSFWSAPNPFTMNYFKEGDTSKWHFIDYPTLEDTTDKKVQEIYLGSSA